MVIKTIIYLFIHGKIRRFEKLGINSYDDATHLIQYYDYLDDVSSVKYFRDRFEAIFRLVLFFIFIYMLFSDKSTIFSLHAVMMFIFTTNYFTRESIRILNEYSVESRLESLNVYKPKEPKENGDEEEEDTCSICYCNLKNNEESRITECKHLFHLDCLKKSLCIKTECPMCNAEIKWYNIKSK